MLRVTALRQAVDLLSLAQRVGPSARGEIVQLRKQLDDLKREHAALAKGPEPIDWEHYSKTITAPGVVEAFRKAYESTQYPKFDITQVLTEIDAAEKKAVAAAEVVSKDAETQLAQLRLQLAALENAKPIEDITVTELLKANPQWQKEIKKELAEDNYV